MVIFVKCGLFLASVLAFPLVAHGEVILDTGVGATGLDYHGDTLAGADSAVGSDKWLAAKFTTTGDFTVTRVQGWLRDNAGQNETATVAIYKAHGNTPRGKALFSAPFTVIGQSSASWEGVEGISWLLPAGAYWVAFEVRSGQNFWGNMADGAGRLESYAVYNERGSGTWQNLFKVRMGVRIFGDRMTANPPPSSP
jgi:hypothetical protein